MTTVLSAPSPKDMASALLTVRMEMRYKEQMTQQIKALGTSYQSKLAALERNVGKWAALRTELAGVGDTLQDTVARLDGIERALRSALAVLEKADADPRIAEYAPSYRSSFSRYTRTVRSLAETTIAGTNLLGKAEANRELSFRTTPVGDTRTIKGAFVGLGYSISDTEGKLWQVDDTGQVLQRYDSSPDQPSDDRGAVDGGLRLDALDGSSITFTVAPSTAGAQTFSGTLNPRGLGVLDPWLYDGIETAAGRDRARVDLKAAVARVGAERNRYEGVVTTIGFYVGQTEAEMKIHDNKTNALLAEQEKKVSALVDQADRRQELLIVGMNHARQMQRQYALLFGQFKLNGSLGQRPNLVGATPAARLFSAMNITV